MRATPLARLADGNWRRPAPTWGGIRCPRCGIVLPRGAVPSLARFGLDSDGDLLFAPREEATD